MPSLMPESYAALAKLNEAIRLGSLQVREFSQIVRDRVLQRRSRGTSLLTAGLIAVLAVGAWDSLSAAPPKTPNRSNPKSAASKKAEPKSRLPVFENSKVNVVGVDPALREEALRSARKIDELINADLARNRIQPNPMTSDQQFVRRAYLTITGTIPRPEQAESYCRSTSPDKRLALIDRLMGTPAHPSHLYNMWADTLRLVDRVGGNNPLEPYREWVKESLRKNRPYDEFVREMLTAEGYVWENPAAGYLLRDRGMPLDNLNNTVRIFLGTQIGCAQCHDHPFDRWTQKEFYQLAAFVAGNDYSYQTNRQLRQMLSRNKPKTIPEGGWFYEKIDYNSPEGRLAQQMLQMNNRRVGENPKAQLRFPKDYAYDNAKPGEVAVPAVIFGANPDLKGKSRREAFANWVTSDGNPRFARTIANRLWKHTFGLGLIEPIDDMKDDTVAVNPELMEYLESEMKRLKYNTREFLRILYYTETFQRQVTYDDLDPEVAYHFPGPVLRRMTAEQVWDSLLTLTVENPDYQFNFVKEFSKAVDLSRVKTVDDALKQVKAYRSYQQLVSAERKKTQYMGQELLPASEMRQPLPDGHFLRQFGQSDREQIDDSFLEGNVPQLLAMFNGAVTHMMLEQGSVIYNTVTARKSVNDQIDVMFWALLSREPTRTERQMALAEIRANGPAGCGNVIWALLNTREFLFVQ